MYLCKMNAWRVLKAGNISFIDRDVNVGFHIEPGDIVFTDICGKLEVKIDKYPYKPQICDCIRLCKIIHYERGDVQIYDNLYFILPRINNKPILKTVGEYIESAIDWEREQKLKTILN